MIGAAEVYEEPGGRQYARAWDDAPMPPAAVHGWLVRVAADGAPLAVRGVNGVWWVATFRTEGGARECARRATAAGLACRVDRREPGG